jgi:hypothetical protein
MPNKIFVTQTKLLFVAKLCTTSVKTHKAAQAKKCGEARQPKRETFLPAFFFSQSLIVIAISRDVVNIVAIFPYLKYVILFWLSFGMLDVGKYAKMKNNYIR